MLQRSCLIFYGSNCISAFMTHLDISTYIMVRSLGCLHGSDNSTSPLIRLLMNLRGKMLDKEVSPALLKDKKDNIVMNS